MLKILILKENRNELRVGITPIGCKYLISIGNEIYIEQGAGMLSGFTDEEYIKFGVKMLKKNQINNDKLLSSVNVIIKLSSLSYRMIKKIKPEQLIISNLNICNNPKILYSYVKNNLTSIGLELVNNEEYGVFNLSNNEIKGKIGVLLSNLYLSKYLLKIGKGKIFGKINGLVDRAVYGIINYSDASYEIIKTIITMGGEIILFETDKSKLNLFNDNEFHNIMKYTYGKLTIIDNTFDTIYDNIHKCDVVINTSSNSTNNNQIRVTYDMVKRLKKGTIIVDLAADQGFCSEVIKKPNFFNKNKHTIFYHNVIFISLQNILSLYPHSSSLVCEKFIVQLLSSYNNIGVFNWIKENKLIHDCIQTYKGDIPNDEIKKQLNLGV